MAVHLMKGGHEVFVVDVWQEHLAAILQDGIFLAGLREEQAKVSGGFNRISALATVKPAVVVLAVKACLLPRILPEVGAILDPAATVVSFQNGLDTAELIAQTLSEHRIFRVVINYAGSIVSPGRIHMSFFHQPNHIGCVCQTKDCHHADELADILTAAALETRAEADIKHYEWEKTIRNAVLSPVSAVTGLTMSAVMAGTHTAQLVADLLEECIAVASKNGYDFGADFFTACWEYLRKAGPHKPSMLVDIENKRETEIDFMNGRIAHYAALAHVPAPLNETFTRLVKALEQRSEAVVPVMA
ncbi:MAG: 2-dehydropantoate 2-reductase [Cyanobacteria bacterium NC_groundwater_1444_Ag_S-0.65um_54_12]|nr:2-dehydropantoate 2-reductase [Cyanobacteria bacterium NC_groundwater_1444_Ag_S-0.65um_54_12]